MSWARLLVLGDNTRAQVAEIADADIEIEEATSWPSVLELLGAARDEGRAFDLLIIDAMHFSASDVDDLGRLRFEPHVIALCPSAESASALHATVDVIVEPVSRGELNARVERATRWRDSDTGKTDLGRRPRKSDVIIGAGEWIKELYDKLSMAAPTDVTVTITGASGTGKELVARTVHSLSRRYRSPFVVVNCAAIPAALIEDELFGHVRGAFTDAARDREGLFSAADGGTIFLDEIGELPPAVQGKLLRVLQTGEFRRIGDDALGRVDVRVVAATNRDLASDVAAGDFREDLFYRINVFPLHLPPLRDRRADIPLLAHHFLRLHSRSSGKRVSDFSAEALQRLREYNWPGNVRELENRVHRALVMARGEQIAVGDLDLPVSHGRGRRELDLDRPFRDLKAEAVARFEIEYVTRLLSKHHGNLAAAARAAGIDRKNLWSIAKKHGVDIEHFRR